MGAQHHIRRFGLAAAVALAWASAALAGPISGYPAATTPLAGNEQIIGTQPPGAGGVTVNFTPAQLAGYAGAAKGFSVDAYGAVGNAETVSPTDDSGAFNAAFTACDAAGGGFVTISAKQYYLAGNVDTKRCVLKGQFQPLGVPVGGAWNAVPYQLVFTPGHSLTTTGKQLNAQNVLITSSVLGIAPPATLREALTKVASFAGTAILAPSSARQLNISDVEIVGFHDSVVSASQAVVMQNVQLDNNGGVAVLINNALQYSSLNNVVDIPYYSDQGFSLPGNVFRVDLPVTGVSSDSGAYCLAYTPSSSLAFVTGDVVYTHGIGGATGANGKFTVTVGDAGCPSGLLLQSSHLAPTGVATVNTTVPFSHSTAASYAGYATLNANPSPWPFWVGDTCTDSASLLPGATTITDVDRWQGVLYLNHTPTGANASDTLTCTHPAYTSGGTISLSSVYRTGTAFLFEGSTLIEGKDVFAFDIPTGFHLTNSVGFVHLTDGGIDRDGEMDVDFDGVSYLIDGGTFDWKVEGGYSSGATAFLINNPTAGQGNFGTIADFAICATVMSNQPGALIETLNGDTRITNDFACNPANIYVGDSNTRTIFNGDEFGGSTAVFRDATQYNTVVGSATSLFSASTAPMITELVGPSNATQWGGGPSAWVAATTANSQAFYFEAPGGITAQISPPGSGTIANYPVLGGQLTGLPPYLQFVGTDTNVGGEILTKGNLGASINGGPNTTYGLVVGTSSAGGGAAGGISTAGNNSLGGATTVNMTTGTNADFVCASAGQVLLIQASACTISSRRFKTDIRPWSGDALAEIKALHPVTFRLKDGAKNPDKNAARTQIGLIAEDVAKVDPMLALYEPDMKTPKSYRQESLIAALVAAVQQQQAEIEALTRRVGNGR